MQWNWQHKNWPRFEYQNSLVTALESKFLHKPNIHFEAPSSKTITSKYQ